MIRSARLIIAITCLVRTSSGAEAGEDAFIAWAKQHAVAAGFDGVANPQERAALRKLVGKAKVVAVGEPVHGAHEPLAFRNRVFRYLVEELGFTAIAVETGFAEARRVNSYIAGNSEPPARTAQSVFHWGARAFQDNRDLIEWLRAYNADPLHRRKVRFYGFDVTGGQNGEMVHSRIGVDIAIQYLHQATPEEADKLQKNWNALADRFSSQGYSKYSDSERQQLRQWFGDFRSHLLGRRKALVTASSDREFSWMLRCVEVSEQTIALLEAGRPTPDELPKLGPFHNHRDSLMAENIRWILGQEETGTRIALFAHNVHMMNAKWEGSGYLEAPAMAGTHLRQLYGKEHVVIGLSAAKGARMSQKESKAGSLDAALSKVSPSPFFLNLRKAPAKGPVASWLREKRFMGSHGKLVLPTVPAFDGLIFVESLTNVKSDEVD